MKNIVLINSIIDTPNLPLSYTNTRSVYSKEERFQQTKYTIETIKKYIPDPYIIIVECSNLSEEEQNYFKNNCDKLLNLFDDMQSKKYIYSNSKSAGEGTMTIKALEYILNLNIEYNSFFKISGRYFLNEFFNINQFINEYNVVKPANTEIMNTTFYKLNKKYIKTFLEFLKNSYDKMMKCIAYEALFKYFIDSINDKKYISNLGCSGNIAICGSLAVA
tara:strand:+ start:3086 stop:3742 length:657 start_codon:yes stop_codon:yes gene_type:complete